MGRREQDQSPRPEQSVPGTGMRQELNFMEISAGRRSKIATLWLGELLLESVSPASRHGGIIYRLAGLWSVLGLPPTRHGVARWGLEDGTEKKNPQDFRSSGRRPRCATRFNTATAPAYCMASLLWACHIGLLFPLRLVPIH